MAGKALLVLLSIFLLVSCRTVLPPGYPLAGMYPTVDISRRLAELKACAVSEEQLRAVLESLRLLEILQAAGFPEKEISLVCRGLTEHGYAEIDARRSDSPLQWISFASPDGKKLEVCAAFQKVPPPRCRFDIMLERTPNRQEGRKIIRNGKPEYQYVSIWHCPMREGAPLELWKVSGERQTDPSWWEIRRNYFLR